MTPADALLLGSCTVRGIILEPMTCWVGQPTQQPCCRGNCNFCSSASPFSGLILQLGLQLHSALGSDWSSHGEFTDQQSGWGCWDVSQVTTQSSEETHGHSEVTVATLRDLLWICYRTESGLFCHLQVTRRSHALHSFAHTMGSD